MYLGLTQNGNGFETNGYSLPFINGGFVNGGPVITILKPETGETRQIPGNQEIPTGWQPVYQVSTYEPGMPAPGGTAAGFPWLWLLGALALYLVLSGGRGGSRGK